MRFGVLWRDVWRSLWRRPVTLSYPRQRAPGPERLRGALHWDPAGCNGCALCVMDCPAEAIELITLDRKARRFVMRYQLDRCTFCAQCVESCRQGCLSMSNEKWELAAASKAPYMITYGDESDVESLLDRSAPPEAEPSTPA